MGGSPASGPVEATKVAGHLGAARSPVAPRTASDLDAALDAGLLTVAYQPVISLETGDVVAVEALARLRDPESGLLLAPDTFIPLAEQTGRIGRVDRMVLEQSAPLAVGWRTLQGNRPFSLGVNVSVAGLSEDGLVDFIADTCYAAGLPYDALIIEITETVLSSEDDHERVLRAIDALGCNVTMDDFGTGYSSLSHLARFPISGIKIDRRFVADLGTRGLGGLVALALVRLGADLGLHVVAEGIETREQLAALRFAGCRFAQGSLISRPVPAAELTALLRSGRPAVPLPRDERQP
jgi:EAL domain-containing protein (putative c-di-GMP-specific phosphodiesterase class I)